MACSKKVRQAGKELRKVNSPDSKSKRSARGTESPKISRLFCKQNTVTLLKAWFQAEEAQSSKKSPAASLIKVTSKSPNKPFMVDIHAPQPRPLGKTSSHAPLATPPVTPSTHTLLATSPNHASKPHPPATPPSHAPKPPPPPTHHRSSSQRPSRHAMKRVSSRQACLPPSPGGHINVI
ncbi:probable pathogenesis-related protein ARB_02861 [Penaeus chinensis]|uniref:probable pathogenesis-related protein ARB_02861 n=1 Tax=Penaeus chinensis TaxID=139456 RepID=UPI001FB6D5D6|nr:probable pathogenesis-related protein ARB_02861 [Penaeus chinensis]